MKKLVLMVAILACILVILYTMLAVSYANESIVKCLLNAICSVIWILNADTYYKFYIRLKKDEKEISTEEEDDER